MEVFIISGLVAIVLLLIVLLIAQNEALRKLGILFRLNNRHFDFIINVSFDYTIKSLNSITHKLIRMSEDLNAIKQTLLETKAVVTKVAADVTRLHAKVDAIEGDVPTAEEWQEVKDLAAGLKSSLQAVDDQTPEEGQ